MNMLQEFRYYLSTSGYGNYPPGSPCLFVHGERWSELCHNVANTKSNRRALKNAGLSPYLIDLPLINVVPGSREANSGFRHGYSRELRLLPRQVIFAAQETLRQYIHCGIDRPTFYLQEKGMADRAESIVVKKNGYKIYRVLIMFLAEDYRDIGIEKVKAYRAWFEQIVEKAICPHKKYLEVNL